MPGFATTVEGKPVVSALSNVDLHADAMSATQKVIDRCESLATATDNKLTLQDRDALKRLAADLKGQLDLADALSQVREPTHSDRLERNDQETFQTELDEAIKRR